MTKPKDPKQTETKISFGTHSIMFENVPETPKRCDECRWWHRQHFTNSVKHGTCNHEHTFPKLWCDPEGTGIICNIDIMFGENFSCKYWEKKEDKQ